MNVLLVDDRAIEYLVIRQRLEIRPELSSIILVAVKTATEAIEIIDEQDAVILDMWIAGDDDTAVVIAACKDKSILFCVYTSDDRPGVRETFEKMGIRFILKSREDKELMDWLQELLREQKQEIENG